MIYLHLGSSLVVVAVDLPVLFLNLLNLHSILHIGLTSLVHNLESSVK
jgi:hypothetical protein